jgi:Uma2 family endonuclease
MATQFAAARRWTYEEFAELPDDGNRYEVIGGELYVTPSPRTLHQVIVSRLNRVLGAFVEEHQLGEVIVGPIDVLFGEGDYMAPDLVFVRAERHAVVSDRGLEEAPDLIIEVLSPGTAKRDRGIKRERYAHFGVPEYWVVDPVARRIEILRVSEGVAEPVEIAAASLDWQPVPGGPRLTLDVAHLFREFR